MKPSWTDYADHVLLCVRLTPKSGSDRIEGPKTLADGSTVLAVRVRAIPEDGAANAALCLLVARALGLPKSRVSVVFGQTHRLKTLRLEGDVAAILAGLALVAL